MTYNFSAGPSILPDPVLSQLQSALINYNNTGSSILSLSHRSPAFIDIIEGAASKLRNLMNIPESYAILFMQGGASTQFAILPMNLMQLYKKASYIDTGVWSTKAAAAANYVGKVAIPYSSKDQEYNYIPSLAAIPWDTQQDYIHITSNNTIYGTCYPEIPDTGDIPLVVDMSSDILSKPYDVSAFDVIYAGAQKNIGPAGLGIVIIKKSLLENIPETVPPIFNYKTFYEHGSLYHTPNTFAIYAAYLVLEWLENQGGVKSIYTQNLAKASLLYTYLDASTLFQPLVQAPYRSIMNIPFTAGDDAIDAACVEYLHRQGIIQIKGHRQIGGLRASLYNAMPIAGVQYLIEHLQAFESGLR